jgi:hypothetical protein
MAGKRIKVISESESGRNQTFVDTRTRKEMTRAEFVREIKQGNYPAYHVRRINGVETQVSNPDESEGNNLDS